MTASNGRAKKLQANRITAADALLSAQRAVTAGIAFDLSAINRYGITVELFDDAAYRVVFIALQAFRLQYPNEKQVTAATLAGFINAMPELRGLFSDEVLPLDGIGPILANGYFDADYIPGNLVTMRESAQQYEWRRKIAELEDLPHERRMRELRAWAVTVDHHSDEFQIINAADLIEQNPTLDPAVIEGIFRIGEVVNLIAKSKIGKSWLVYGMVLSIAFGLLWLGRFTCMAGKVLLIDNELKPNTLAGRLAAVARAFGIDPAELRGRVDVICLRGQLKDIEQLGGILNESIRGKYVAVFMDAGYKFLPAGWKENENGDMTRFYNLWDYYAVTIGAAIVTVVHATKGSQSDKDVTDVGSGAGAISRSADTHLIFRPHEEPGVVVMEAALRSFKPLEPLPIRYEFPRWFPADDLDPNALKGTRTAKANEVAAAKLDGKRKAIVEYLMESNVKTVGATKSAIRDNTGVNAGLMEAIRTLVKDGNLVACTVVNPQNGISYPGFKLKPDESQADSRTAGGQNDLSVCPGAGGGADGHLLRRVSACSTDPPLSSSSGEQLCPAAPEDETGNITPNGKRKTRRKKPSTRKASA